MPVTSRGTTAPWPPAAQLFLVTSTYLRPFEELETFLDAHRGFLDQGYRDGAFLVSGPLVDGTGSVLLAYGDSIAGVTALAARDPFVARGLADLAVTPFRPTRHRFPCPTCDRAPD